MRQSLSPASWTTLLSDVWDVGVIVLGSDKTVDFANARARMLLGTESDASLADAWSRLRGNMGSIFDQAAPGAAAPVETTLQSGLANESAILRVQLYVIHEDDCVGYLLLLQPADRAAAVETSLRHASRNLSLAPLVRDLAHDIKGVLNVIAMHAELLSRVGTGATDKSALAHRSSTVIRRELSRLDHTIDVVLDRSLVERDEPRTFDLCRLCQGLVELVSARAQRQEVEVVLELPDGPFEVHGYPERLHVALLGLMVNALDAMPDGGTLRVKGTGGTAVRLRFSDSGPGIEPGRVQDVWRLHYTTKAKGTGIGLHVARTIVEAHQGRLTYQPNPEGGACFVVDLPLATEPRT